MKKITKKEINERIKSILLRSSHNEEKLIFKEIIKDNLYENSFKTIAIFKTVDTTGFIVAYFMYGSRNEFNELKVVMCSTLTNYGDTIEI